MQAYKTNLVVLELKFECQLVMNFKFITSLLNQTSKKCTHIDRYPEIHLNTIRGARFTKSHPYYFDIESTKNAKS